MLVEKNERVWVFFFFFKLFIFSFQTHWTMGCHQITMCWDIPPAWCMGPERQMWNTARRARGATLTEVRQTVMFLQCYIVSTSGVATLNLHVVSLKVILLIFQCTNLRKRIRASHEKKKYERMKILFITHFENKVQMSRI